MSKTAKTIVNAMNTNNEKQEGISMKKATSNTTSEVMNAKEFKQKSYDAYLAYVDFIEGKKSISETVDALSPLMAAYGLILTLENLANLLTVKMTAYGKDKGEQAKKVKSISTFRAFVKGGWKDVKAAPVHSNAGKNPADVKTSAKAKKPTKADMEAKIAELEALLAASKSEEQKAAWRSILPVAAAPSLRWSRLSLSLAAWWVFEN